VAKWTPISLDEVKSYPLQERYNKVKVEDFGSTWQPGGSMNLWLKSLPKILAGNDFAEIVDQLVRAAASKKTNILAMGAHAIKVGLNPVILDLFNRRIISSVAMNGAGIIHDAEVAMVGGTSEDVAGQIGTGKFGMAEETGKFLNAAISDGSKQGLGLGRSVGAMLIKENFPYNRKPSHARIENPYRPSVESLCHIPVSCIDLNALTALYIASAAFCLNLLLFRSFSS